jgi:hypothetical protein
MTLASVVAHDNRRMEKSIYTHDHRVFIKLLRETRQAADVTQGTKRCGEQMALGYG